ncbi:hypothetical protein Q2T40_09325 [Winogradskyella maritima]|uniref:Uncharacterized protein n=1 Tax=Winogradskyella maritima TaxID=1517766 RepID=A0ABV8AGL8_9FLAO|nr:hypothetical protein [Winogradskyella maritima]
MTRNILIIYLIFSCSLSHGQYEWTSGKLILKDGDSLVGFIQIPMTVVRLVSFGKSKVEFKENLDDIVQSYDKSQVDKIYFNTYDVIPGYYEYMPLKKRKYRIFKLLLDGKVKLYTRTVAIEHKEKIIDNSNNPNSDVDVFKYYYEEEQEFYVIREGETKLTPLISHYFLSDFKNRALKYFLDCKDLTDYLKEDLYSEIDIIELVNDYNLFCE